MLQECEADLSPPEGYSFRWLGDNPRKGLGLLSRSEPVLIHPVVSEWTYFMPVSLPAMNLNVVAVWAFNHRAAKRYGAQRIGSASAVIRHLAPWLLKGRSIVAGDFNNSIKWDRQGNPYNFQTIADDLHSCGLRSAYHSLEGKAYGTETIPTYFHTKNQEKSHHIDFCFVHESIGIRRVEIGEFSAWREHSDHVPLVIDLNDA